MEAVFLKFDLFCLAVCLGENMESALILGTEDIIEAKSLKNDNDVKKRQYCCRGCFVPLYPAAYQNDSKRRAYFRTGSSHPHDEDCEIAGEVEYLKKIKENKISKKQGLPFSYPNKLILKETRAETDNSSGKKGSKGSKQTKKNNTNNQDDTGRKRHNHSVFLIRSICQTYLAFADYQRDKMKLDASSLGIEGQTYSSVFELLSSDSIKHYSHKKIFYAPIKWSTRGVKPISKEGNIITIQLAKGVWKDNKLEDKDSYKLIINMEGWKESKKRFMLQEITRYEKTNSAKNEIYAFFIAEQTQGNDNLFIVNHHYYVSLLPKNPENW